MSLKNVHPKIAEIITGCGIGWLADQSILSTNEGQKVVEINTFLRQKQVSTDEAPIACLYDKTPGVQPCYRFIRFELSNVQRAKDGKPTTVAVRMSQHPDTVPDKNGIVRRRHMTLEDFFEYNLDLRGKSDSEAKRLIEEQVMMTDETLEREAEERQAAQCAEIVDKVLAEETATVRPKKKRPIEV
jgi:hypothetical protein